MIFSVSFVPLVYAATIRELYESAVGAYNHGQFDQAISFYQEIIKEAPQFAPAYVGVGLALKDKGADIEEVLYYYKLAVEKDPTNSQAMEQLGRLYYSIGRLDKAQVVYERALKINPNLPDVKISLGWTYLMGKRISPKRAIMLFRDVIKIVPTPNAYFGLGMAYFADNQREKALDIITQLKGMGQEALAGKLEKAVRENKKVVLNTTESSSDNQSDGRHDQVDNKNANAVDNDTFEKTDNSTKGLRVRLRGKLNEL